MSEKKILFVGIGNRFKGDDGFGVVLTQRLNNYKKENLFFIQCEEVPENYLIKIVELQPDVIVFVDTIYEKDLSPGKILLLEEVNSFLSISTHAGSLKTIIEFLKLQGLNFKSYVLGVVPENVDLGEGVSPGVERAINEITHNFHHYLEKFLSDD
ncbi:MAG: hypothetical protein B6D53_04285 [Candidatus Omnitrophica bacterium 4484_49]|nr:MAG: hypothetical protein B6D53_04285 [Candidatus Omnitrophica bacterium 4484_49]